MKLSGGILVLVSMIFTGVMISSRLKKRREFLGEAVMFISQVSMEIEYINLPLLEILEKTSENNCCRSLDFIDACLELWKKGEDFSYSWETSVENSPLPMRKEERQKLGSLSSLLGTSDAKGQKNMLSLFKKYFTAYYEKAEAEYEKYGRMSIMLGIAFGTGAFIIMM